MLKCLRTTTKPVTGKHSSKKKLRMMQDQVIKINMNKCRYICIYQRRLQIDNFCGYLNILVFVVPPFMVVNMLREFPNKCITTQHHGTQHVLYCMSVAICFTSWFLWFTHSLCVTHTYTPLLVHSCKGLVWNRSNWNIESLVYHGSGSNMALQEVFCTAEQEKSFACYRFSSFR